MIYTYLVHLHSITRCVHYYHTTLINVFVHFHHASNTIEIRITTGQHNNPIQRPQSLSHSTLAPSLTHFPTEHLKFYYRSFVQHK